MDEPRDDALYVERVLQGDRDAFRELVQRYNRTVFRIAYSMCGNTESAKDAVQEVFYRAFKGLGSYNATYSFPAWIRRITVNYMLDQRKKKRIQTTSLTTDDDQEIDVRCPASDPHETHFQGERDNLVLQAIEQLPDKYKIVLMLRHIENLSYDEIAQALSLPVGTVMTHIHRAREKLSEILQPMRTELLS